MHIYTKGVFYRYVALLWIIASGSALALDGLVASVLNCFRTDYSPANRVAVFQRLHDQYAKGGDFFRTVQTASPASLDRASYGLGPRDAIFEIATGKTGIAYYVRPEEGEPYVIKKFFDPLPVKNIHQGIDADKLKFDLIARALEQVPDSNLKIVSATRVGPDALKTDYAHGQRLDLFLEDPNIPDPIKRYVIGVYNHDVSRLGEELMNDRELEYVRPGKEKKGGRAVPRTWKHYFLRGNTLLGFDIRPDQVIVNPETLQITIVDPW